MSKPVTLESLSTAFDKNSDENRRLRKHVKRLVKQLSDAENLLAASRLECIYASIEVIRLQGNVKSDE